MLPVCLADVLPVLHFTMGQIGKSEKRTMKVRKGRTASKPSSASHDPRSQGLGSQSVLVAPAMVTMKTDQSRKTNASIADKVAKQSKTATSTTSFQVRSADFADWPAAKSSVLAWCSLCRKFWNQQAEVRKGLGAAQHLSS